MFIGIDTSARAARLAEAAAATRPDGCREAAETGGNWRAPSWRGT